MLRKRSFHIISILLLSLLGVVSCGKSNSGNKVFERTLQPMKTGDSTPESRIETDTRVKRIRVNPIGPLYKVFNDSNYQQLMVAQRLGIEPVEDLSSAYFMKRPLVKVTSNEYYQIDSLRHSLPYLVPEAAELLQDLGRNFIDSLHKRGGDNYKIKVTSLLRTPESVGRLRRVNINATDSSTHQYATTFDISYTNFYSEDESTVINQGDLKNILAEVIKDLRDQGRCLVKYEYKTGCFHITVAQ